MLLKIKDKDFVVLGYTVTESARPEYRLGLVEPQLMKEGRIEISLRMTTKEVYDLLTIPFQVFWEGKICSIVRVDSDLVEDRVDLNGFWRPS